MKTTIFLSCFLALFMLPIQFVKAQNFDSAITFEVKDQSLEATLAYFEEVSNIPVAYNQQLVEDAPSQNWSFTKTPSKKVINSILEANRLTYKNVGGQLILAPYQPKTQNFSGTPSSIKEGKIIIEGLVQDAETKESIPFAHLTLKGRAEGTAANEYGQFRLVLDADTKGQKVVVSSLGYQNSEFVVEASVKAAVISLKSAAHELDEVVVDGKQEKAIDILKEAIAKIPENYPTTTTNLEAYYRELIKTNGVFTRFADAACVINYQGGPLQETDINDFRDYYSYSKWNLKEQHFRFPTSMPTPPNMKDSLEILEARASDNLQKYGFQDKYKSFQSLEVFGVGGGPMRLNSYDYVRSLSLFFDKEKLKKYSFEIEEYTVLNNRPVYVLSFSPKKRLFKSANEKGEIIIDDETKGILKFNYTNKKRLKWSSIEIILVLGKKAKKEFGVSRVGRKTTHNHANIEVEYTLFEGRYYLKRITEVNRYLNSGAIIPDISYQTHCDLLVHKANPNTHVKIAQENVYRTVAANHLADYPLSYNPEFWKNYPYMLSDKVMQEALKDLERTHSLEEQFANRVTQDSTLKAPVAKIETVETQIHGETLRDDYAWLKDKYSEEAYDYFEAENNFTNNHMIPWRKLQRKLYYEMVDKTEQNYESLPTKMGEYYYGYRYEKGVPHEVYFRKKESTEADEEVILDVNEIAKGYSTFFVEGLFISPKHDILGYTENTTGGYENIIRFKDLKTGELIKDSLQNVSAMVWLNDNKTILYTQADSANREYKVFKHTLGSSAEKDELLFEEKDKHFSISLYKSNSKKYIVLNISSKDENEVHLLPADGSRLSFEVVEARKPKHQYGLREYENSFFVLSNKDNENFDVFKTSNTSPGAENWEKVLASSKDTLINSASVIGQYLIVSEDVKMKTHFKIIDLKTGAQDFIKPDSLEVFEMEMMSADEGETQKLKFALSSPIRPREVYEYNLASKETKLIRTQKVKDFKTEKYSTERIYATATDGTKIPITLVYKKELAEGETRRLHLRSYGAYGISTSTGFNVGSLPFIDRGGIVAYAHVRGGGEMGQAWYEAGKMLQKKNTFSDFITCAEFLIQEGHAKKGEIIASGGSAGGLLMGNIINERPELFKAVILNVPFLDVLNTMLDEELPLTTGEYQEWGNPNEKEYYDYMKSYSPYDNVKKQNYPHLLFLTAFNDENVGCWEAGKMVAKLRKFKTDNNTLLLKTNMSAGHGGGAGRFAYFKEQSFIQAFVESVWGR